MSIDAMKQALEYTRPGAIVPVTPETVKILVDALRLAIEQAEKQESYWQEEARRYAGNADFWREKAKRQPLTDEDWAQIWADFEDTDVENDFQDYMVEKHGPGYYVDADDRYWIFQQQVIRRIVDSKLAGEGNEHSA
jgi:hypothetical protein